MTEGAITTPKHRCNEYETATDVRPTYFPAMQNAIAFNGTETALVTFLTRLVAEFESPDVVVPDTDPLVESLACPRRRPIRRRTTTA